MLRVLTLSTLFPDASRPNFGIFVEQQTRALAARADVDVRVVAPLGVPPWPLGRHARYAALTRLEQHELWRGLDVRRPRFLNLPGLGGRLHAAMLERALVPVIAAVRRDFAFDLIAAEFFFPDGPAAVALGRRFGVPVTIKARGADIHGWGRAPAVGAQVRAAGCTADGLLAVSEAMRGDMVALGMPGDRIEVSLTGIDPVRFAVRERAAARAALGVAGPLVVSAGALIERKGHDLVIDAVARLPGVSLWIAGEGPERGRLAARIARLGLGARVRLLGSVPHGEMPDLLAAADVMALASASEGLANAWVEALASGTPVVIPDVGGAREVVTCDAAGRIVARSAGGFADGIAAVLAAAPAPEKVRISAERFSWEANAKHLYDFYSRVVNYYGASRN